MKKQPEIAPPIDQDIAPLIDSVANATRKAKSLIKECEWLKKQTLCSRYERYRLKVLIGDLSKMASESRFGEYTATGYEELSVKWRNYQNIAGGVQARNPVFLEMTGGTSVVSPIDGQG